MPRIQYSKLVVMDQKFQLTPNKPYLLAMQPVKLQRFVMERVPIPYDADPARVYVVFTRAGKDASGNAMISMKVFVGD